MDLISIIMPCYNAQKFIGEAIQSIINQTYQNWELIIVDDCSTDDSVKNIHNFSDSRIKLFLLEENNGAGFARNYATEKSNGNYICFLDADDFWKPYKLEVQLNFMKENNLPITFSFYECIDESGKPNGKLIKSPNRISFNNLKYCNWIGNLTGIYNVDFFGKNSISTVKKRQDWILWLDLSKKVEFIYPVKESLAYYRIRKNSISSSKMKLLKSNYWVYRNYHQMNEIQSILAMIKFLCVHFSKKFLI